MTLLAKSRMCCRITGSGTPDGRLEDPPRLAADSELDDIPHSSGGAGRDRAFPTLAAGLFGSGGLTKRVWRSFCSCGPSWPFVPLVGIGISARPTMVPLMVTFVLAVRRALPFCTSCWSLNKPLTTKVTTITKITKSRQACVPLCVSQARGRCNENAMT